MQLKGGGRNWKRWKQLKTHLSDPHKNEKEYRSRKARVNWFREGDRNTHYFHVVTAERKKRNRMESIITGDRTECCNEKEIAGEIARYFEAYLPLIIQGNVRTYLKGSLK